MKNVKAVALLLLALIAGLAAAIYAAGWVSRQGNIDSNKVVVAAMDIQLGTKIDQQMLTTADWPRGSVPEGAFHDLKSLQDRVAKVSLLRGEPLLEGKLAPVGTRGGLSAVIAEGKRAMTVRVNDVVGVAGFALPGNYVDVMVNTERDEGGKGRGRQISKTVLEQVLVLAVAQQASRDDTTPKVVNAVTLELTPEEAEKLDLARSVGTLSLVLRNQIDKAPVATAGVTKKQLFEDDQPDPVKAVRASHPVKVKRVYEQKPKPAPSQCVEVIQNGARSLSCFPQ